MFRQLDATFFVQINVNAKLMGQVNVKVRRHGELEGQGQFEGRRSRCMRMSRLVANVKVIRLKMLVKLGLT